METTGQDGTPSGTGSVVDWGAAPPFGRRVTILRALRLLESAAPGPQVLVETGTLRDDSPRAMLGDGWSTLALAWYAGQTGGRAVTVDIDTAAMQICRRATAAYADHLEYATLDSRAFFADWLAGSRPPIALLYLDSFDYHDPAASEKHHLSEAIAALPALADTCLVLIDDTHAAGEPGAITGKGARVIPFLLARGFTLEWCEGGQALLSRGVTAAMREEAEAGARRAAKKTGISVIIHAYNEEANLPGAIESARHFAGEILVADMASTDSTAAVATACGARVVPVAPTGNIDRARDESAAAATFDSLFYLDADERVPPELGALLQDLVQNRADDFVAVQVAFRTYFGERELTGLRPGYKAPPLLKRGTFSYHARLHEGPRITGRILRLPPDPSLSVTHRSYRDFNHYVNKMNRYTDTEAANMMEDGRRFSWRNMAEAMARDLSGYYDGTGLKQDGTLGLLYSLASLSYRLYQHAKLYELRQQAGETAADEEEAPASAQELLEYMLNVVMAGRIEPQINTDIQRLGAVNVAVCAGEAAREAESCHTGQNEAESAGDAESSLVPVCWSGPVLSGSGYGEDCRSLISAARAAAISVVPADNGWAHERLVVESEEGAEMAARMHAAVVPGYVQVLHDFPVRWQGDPRARAHVGRTMFETDRIPVDWVDACNRMDRIWVPSRFNLETFAASGVERERIAVVPCCIVASRYAKPAEVSPLVADLRAAGRFVFLMVCDWTLRKGWDAAIRAFVETFAGRDDVALVIKTWSSLGYGETGILGQAEEFARAALGHDLLNDPRIRFVFQRLSHEALVGLYHSVDAYCGPGRGEGWGLPYMEAMACGLPVIGAGWSGCTEFMTHQNSCPLELELVEVPEQACREAPAYRGHRWAEPSHEHLCDTLRRVTASPGEARERGERARREISERFSPEVVGRIVRAEIERLVDSTRSEQGVLLPAGLKPGAETRNPPARVDARWSGAGADGGISTTGNPGGSGPSARAAQQRPRVRVEGAVFNRHSLAHVNCELGAALMGLGGVDLSFAPSQPAGFTPRSGSRHAPILMRINAPLPGAADITIRHMFPPNFEKAQEGKLVLILPWEFGTLPEAWVKLILQNVDEVWCPSRYVLRVCLASGIPAEKLVVVPNGVDTQLFHPGAQPMALTTAGLDSATCQRPFRFLYAGGTIWRKGADIVLEAYRQAFGPGDNVCLVVKDCCTTTAYRGMNLGERIRELPADASYPPVVYLDGDLTDEEMPALYTACDCLVAPYRGEGFCLTALEAAVCGLPVITTLGGATDDFIDEEVGWRIPAGQRSCADAFTGEMECVDTPWVYEPDPRVVAEVMRQVFQSPHEAKRRGAQGAKRAQQWTWRAAAEKAAARIADLAAAVEAGNDTRNPRAPVDGARPATPITAQLPPRRVKIALCMIAKNEERVIGACLRSVMPFVETTVVVDTGSTDRTVEIAAGLGARVEQFAWCDSFAAARNESLRCAPVDADFILWVDCDDTISPETGLAIRRAAETAPPHIMGFVIPVQFVEDGRQSGTRVDHVKLFRNRPELRFEGRIHEQIMPSIGRLGGGVARINAVVLHSGYDSSPEGQARKRARDEKLLELDLQDDPNHPFKRFNKGMTYHFWQEHEVAVEWLQKSLEVSRPEESHVRKAYALLGASLRALGRTQECIARLNEGLAAIAGDPEIHFQLGYVHTALGRFAEAYDHYVACQSADTSHYFTSIDRGILTYKTWHNLGTVCAEMKRYAEAKEWWQKAIAAEPGHLASISGLYMCATAQGDYDTARRMVEAAGRAEPLSETWASMGANLEERGGGPAAADAFIVSAIEHHPEAPGPRLVYARRLLAAERVAEAEPHLQALEAQGIAEAAYCLGIAAVRGGDLQQAVIWMERAHSLNPEHAETTTQLEKLRAARSGGA